MEHVNGVVGALIRLPKRKPRRWPFAGGRWTRTAPREVQVVDLAVYRQRRRPRLPVAAVATVGGGPT